MEYSVSIRMKDAGVIVAPRRRVLIGCRLDLEERKKEKKERKKSMLSIECRRTGRGPIVMKGVNVCGKNECFYCHTNYISH